MKLFWQKRESDWLRTKSDTHWLFCHDSNVSVRDRRSCEVSGVHAASLRCFLVEIGELSQTTLARWDQTRYWASEKQILLVVVNCRQTESRRPRWERHSHNAIRISPLHHAAHLMFPKHSAIDININGEPSCLRGAAWCVRCQITCAFHGNDNFPFQVAISADSFINTRSHWEQLSQCLPTADIILRKSTADVRYWWFLCAEQRFERWCDRVWRTWFLIRLMWLRYVRNIETLSHLARFGILADRSLIRSREFGRVVVHVQDADAHRRLRRHGLVIWRETEIKQSS